jgi:hypothetical protein
VTNTQPAPFSSVAAWLPFVNMTQALVGERFLKVCPDRDFYPCNARRLFAQDLT